MEKVSTADQIYNGMKYMVVTLSFIHARMVFIQLERKQFDAAEIYIMNFENRKWWDRALNANKRFGGAHIDEEDLIYEVLGQTFSTLKAAVFEGKGHYDMALKCFLGNSTLSIFLVTLQHGYPRHTVRRISVVSQSTRFRDKKKLAKLENIFRSSNGIATR